ncbi:MAG: hypothetical protein GX154_06180 [Clostridiales bacterium]|nr:hypothetical protein [Clostridiales bacterium]
MATKSLKNININDKETAKSLISAIEEAKNKSSIHVISKRIKICQDATVERIKELFGDY